MPTEKITFRGASGEALAARLDGPATPPRAYVLFAHCFTCTKDIFAASRIARTLNEAGFAVFRFDFTGLGHSEGEFANTNFSSNVQDLIAAADYLRSARSAPAVLIGHSLGGAAVLAAAPHIADVRAVATIGAPADPEHVSHLFAESLGQIDAEGEAHVNLAGRSFTIRKQFIDDIRSQRLADDVARMRKALLVMHSPRDDTVGVDNAGRIFQAARHPKSFVSLDDADHLLTRRADAEYAAAVIAGWASRYVPAPEIPKATAKEGEVRVVETHENPFAVSIAAGTHHLRADEPESVGGGNSGPTPYDLLLGGLGACTAMTVRMYARRKNIALDEVSVRLTHKKIHAADCEKCETKEGRIDRIERALELRGELDESTRRRLLEIADKCPVHRTLTNEVVIDTRLQE